MVNDLPCARVYGKKTLVYETILATFRMVVMLLTKSVIYPHFHIFSLLVYAILDDKYVLQTAQKVSLAQ